MSRFRRTAFFARALLLLFCLQGLPVTHNLAWSISLYISENMRVPINQLVRQPVKHIVDGEVLLLGGHFCIEQHLEEQVTKFPSQFVPVARFDGLEDLVRFFERVGFYGIEGLFAVPGASARGTEARHDGGGALESFASCRH